MQPVQLTFASPTRHALFPEEWRRREALHVIGRVVGGRVALFALVDDHFHLVLLCERDAASAHARALLLALRAVAAVELAPAHVSEVRGRAHLEWLVRYLLEQPAHHGISAHTALVTGSCFPELVGARCVPGLALQLGVALPRFRLREAFPMVGLPSERLEPASDEQVRAAGARRLVDAASFAAAAGPDLTRLEPSVRARRVAAHLASGAGVHLDDLAHAMGTTRDAARKIGLRPAAPELVAATRLRLALQVSAGNAAAALTASTIAAASKRGALAPREGGEVPAG